MSTNDLNSICLRRRSRSPQRELHLVFLLASEGHLVIPPKKDLGGWVSPFCRTKSDFWRPRPLQNEEPATNLAREFFSTKSGRPTPVFWRTFMIFRTLALQSGEPGMSTHLSRIATWKKENPQKYKDPFCRGMMWKNLGLPVSHENPLKCTKNNFVEAIPVPHFQIL